MEQRIIIFFFIFFFLSCSKSYEVNEKKYETGKTYLKEHIYRDKNYIHSIFYYSNGNIKESINFYIPKKDEKTHAFGLLESFYFDGFPKEYCMLTDSGRNVHPTKERILEGFETQFDYVPIGARDEDGNKYTIFRLFIKDVHPIDQIITIEKPNGESYHAFKMKRVLEKYNIVNENGTIKEIEIDETLYPFLVPINNKFMTPIGDGKYELKVGVFFQEFVGDEDLPSPHVSFTAIIDPDEEFF